MTSMNRYSQLIAVTVMVALPLSAADLTLEQTLAKMDQVAARFKGLSCNVEMVHHMQVIHEDDAQSGAMLVKRARPKDLHVKISIDKPEKKVAYVDGKKADVYYPSSQETEEMALGSRKSFLDIILTLGFGGSSKELQADFQVTLGGPDMVAGESATRLELIPKSPEMLEEWKKVELWISDKSGYSVQQKFFERGGDYNQITYTNIQLNPEIQDQVFSIPKGTLKEQVNKKK
jgi:outer membrane lipoprotein-sorting protein